MCRWLAMMQKGAEAMDGEGNDKHKIYFLNFGH